MKKLLVLFLLFFPLNAAASVCAIQNQTTPDWQTVDASIGTEYLAQEINLGSNCTVGAIGGSFSAVNTRTDGIFFAIWSSTGSGASAVPNALLQTCSLMNNGGWTGSQAWATSTCAATVTLNSGTNYWIVAYPSTFLHNGSSWYRWYGLDSGSLYWASGNNVPSWTNQSTGFTFEYEIDSGSATIIPSTEICVGGFCFFQ
jgi:hypothetical protein